jgi:small-conductance mechanosensitive channel
MNWDDIRAYSSRLAAWIAWLPDWLVGIALLAAATLAALLVHRWAIGLLERLIGPHQLFVASLLRQTRGPTRLAIVIAALSLTLQATAFNPVLAQVLGHALIIALVVLIGWIAVIAIRTAAELYLRRFRVDAEDNLLARTHATQVRILERAAYTLTVVLTVAFALMTFDSVRHYGVSLFASAGIAGLAVGLAARPLLSNLIAGVQIAITQPIRLEDAVVVNGEFGWIDEIAATYVVIRVWDERRLIVPLSDFIEKPFQNWTRRDQALLGSVMIRVDYTAPVPRIRDKLNGIVAQSKLWDGKVVNLQVTDCSEMTIELRALVSARSAAALWDLRCEVREQLIDFLQRECPGALPRRRQLTLQEPGPGTRPGEADAARAASAA